MENPQKKINIDVDRLSNLPGDVIERIMGFLPVRDAARTCVLSSKWRYIWSDHPSLVLDKQFWDDVQKHISPERLDNIRRANIVGSVLLLHVGQIRKFVFDVPQYMISNDLDLWLTSLCRRRHLKVLQLKNSNVNERYKVPYCVLVNSELTNLTLYFCNIPKGVGCCFSNIQKLHLEDVEVHSSILNTPVLTSLTIKNCTFHAYDFEIIAPRLSSLAYEGFLNLTPFLRCTDINYAFLYLYSGSSVQGDGKNLVELLDYWPTISQLVVDGYCFKELATGHVPDNDLIIPLTLRRFLLWNVSLDSELIAWILYILKNSPFLQKIEIWFGKEVMNDFDEPSMSTDLRMDRLHTVILKDFTASRNEVMFVKILLKCAPSLGKVLVDENENVDPNERMKILKELLLLQKKYHNTNIIFAPNLVSARKTSS